MKGSRHEMILSLISSEQIGTLEELMVKLQEQGVYVSQSSLSHDIRDLKITKVRASDGRLMFVKPEDADEITAKQKQEKEKKQQQSSKYSDVIPDNIPENIQKRLVTLFEKLDEAYPNKVITGLQKDHKNYHRQYRLKPPVTVELPSVCYIIEFFIIIFFYKISGHKNNLS